MAGRIAVLPPEVVNRIAAGEVVQRPVSVVKELLENSLDAGASKVVVTFTPPPTLKHESCGKIVVSDNGCGMPPEDLTLAATRHATSKLRSVEDFDTLQSFGFRGEAVASISMVSRLVVTTRTAAAPSGYTMRYVDGKPLPPAKPVPRARPVGTTMAVQDLFYNLRQRRPSRDDFKQILDVCQKYALLCAARGVGVACERTGASMDLNTGSTGLVTTLHTALAADETPEKVRDLQARATKQVIAMVYGASLENHLKHWECRETDEQGESMYECTGWMALPSYGLVSTKKEKPQFILFINNRLVESRPIQRALEDVYAQFAPQKPPFLFLSIQVPPTTVDVNVHPNKRECALLNLDAIIRSLVEHVRQILEDAGQSFSAAERKPAVVKNPYKRRRSDPNENEPTQLSQKALSQASLSQKSIPSSKKVRTSRASQSGALEPFLVRKTPFSQTSTASNGPSSQSSTASSPTHLPSQDGTKSTIESSSATMVEHQPGCPLLEPAANVDLSQPGAFAAVSSQCTCNAPAAPNVGAATAIRLPRQALSKVYKVPPRECEYESVGALRDEVQKQADPDLQIRLRKAYFVGVVNAQRSLVQVEEELVLFHHGEAAKELFYQLVLNHFPGGATVAEVGPIDVYSVIANLMHMEGTMHSSAKCPSKLEISETTRVQAEQAATFLFQKEKTLRECFSIVVEQDAVGRIILKGLPVLLEGYTPSPHALPLFLLRIATEVNWEDEKRCFQGIGTELGRFYASIPTDDHIASHVRHSLFPALTSLLVPQKDLSFEAVTKLSKLYRVFERC